MLSRLALTLTLSSLLGLGISQSIQVSPVNVTDDIESNIVIAGKIVDNQPASILTPILNLTRDAVDGLGTMGLVGQLYHATPSNLLNITSDVIALISCDSKDYSGFVGVADVFQAAESANATAVLFYTTEGSYCEYRPITSMYRYVYATKGAAGANAVLNYINASAEKSDHHVWATIGRPDELNNKPPQQGNQGQGKNAAGPSPSTAVAMIILYSITGVITGLFLVIIVTGAIRAHRHPERYGPRNILGRARQTRARGLARAIVDTIPIIKFGERDGAPKDVELASGSNSVVNHFTGHGVPTTIREGEESANKAPRQSTAEINPTVAAVASGSGSAEAEDAPVCSICTDDFEAGQDLRVLPCDHKFHPACIDPWLLNVSGTCPLCRIDLRPADQRDSTDGQGENGELPPPLDQSETGERRRTRTGLGLRRGLLGGMNQFSRIGQVTPEERLVVARRLRNETVAVPEREEGDENHASAGTVSVAAPSQETASAPTIAQEESSRRRRFSLFGIRTRRRGDE